MSLFPNLLSSMKIRRFTGRVCNYAQPIDSTFPSKTRRPFTTSN